MTNLPALRRDRADARVGGVCAALARSWGVDPLVVRVAFVVLTLVTNGFALAAYAALWALVPVSGSDTEPIRDLLAFTRSWSRQVLVAVVVSVAALLGLMATGSGPAVLIVVGLAWLILSSGVNGRRGRIPDATPLPAPRTEFERVAQAWQLRLDNVDAGRPAEWTPPVRAGVGAADGAKPVRNRRGRMTWFGVLAALGAVWTGLAVAGAAGYPAPTLAWASATLAVLGLALVIVSRPARAAHGRPWGLVVATVATLLSTVALMLPGDLKTAPLAPHSVGVLTTATVGGRHDLPAGEHVLDLSDVAVSADTHADFRLDLGSVVLDVPPDGNVIVNVRVDFGEARLPGTTDEGIDVEHSWSRIDDPAAPTLTVDVNVGLGEVEVRS